MDHVTLRDGRRLDIRVVGPEDGPVVLFHVGTPMAATPMRFLERAAAARGLRVVSMGRPGFGASTPRPGRRVVDAVDDSADVLAALGVDDCLVLGWSGGGPHALACAARLPQVTAVAVLAGLAPPDAEDLDWTAGMGADNVEGFEAAREGEHALRAVLERDLPGVTRGTLEDLMASLETLLPDVDRRHLTDELGEDMLATTLVALSGGVDGWTDDGLAHSTPWGFELDEVAVPVTIWHGSADLMVPLTHGRWLARHVPGAQARFFEGEGHVSVVVGRVEEILDELVAAGARPVGRS